MKATKTKGFSIQIDLLPGGEALGAGIGRTLCVTRLTERAGAPIHEAGGRSIQTFLF